MSELDAGGSIKLKGDHHFQRIRVSGAISVDGSLEVDDEIIVSGSFRVKGNIRANSVDVSGSATIDGDLKTRETRVKGSLKAGNIDSSFIEIYGSLSGREIRVEEAIISGSLRCDKLYASNRVIVSKNSKVYCRIVANRVEVGKKAEVDEIVAREVLVKRDAEVDEVKAERVVVEKGAEISVLEYSGEAIIDEKADVEIVRRIESIPELRELERED